MSFFFHSHAQTKSCPKQTFSLERNHSWDFLQHSGNNVKSSLADQKTAELFQQALAISFLQPIALLATGFKRHKSKKFFK